MSEMQIVDQSLDKSQRVTKLEKTQADFENAVNQELKDLLKENLKVSQEIRVMVSHINRYVAWQRIFGVIKIFIVLVPIIIGFIYLPPLLKDLFKQVLSIYNPG